MFIRTKKRKNGKTAVQIVESYRRGDKVSQNIVRHIGQGVSEHEIEALTALANTIIAEIEEQRQPSLPFFEPEKLIENRKKRGKVEDHVRLNNLKEEQRVIDGIGDVFGKLYSDLGFDNILTGTRKKEQWNSILKACVMSTLANPVSKRRTASLLEEDFGVRIPLEKIYRMMDHLANQEELIKKHIEKTTLSLFKEKVEVLFFDVTTLYFESFTPDDLRKSGYSKDNKFKETQIVLALVTTSNGLPITYKIFPGATYEGHTLLDMLADLGKTFAVDKVTIVADRAMFTEDNLTNIENHDLLYIIAAKLKTLPKNLKEKILTSNFNEITIGNEISWVKEFEYKSRRLIVSYSKKRAEKDAKDRQRLIDRMQKKVRNGKIKIADLISNHGTKRFLSVHGGEAIINEEKITESARWDGLHGVITNAPETSASDLLSRYRDLWQIEEAFRVNKHNLKMRPIYHWTESRIKAHISICFIAYTLVKQALYRLSVQKDMDISFERLRNELLHVQSSILVEKNTKERYVLPSKVTVNQKKIYKAFDLTRSETPYKLI